MRDEPALLRGYRSSTPFLDPPGYSTPSMVRATTPPLRYVPYRYSIIPIFTISFGEKNPVDTPSGYTTI